LHAVACSARRQRQASPKKIEPTYKQTGRLQLHRYDSNGDGKFDTFSHGRNRILRIEIDQNEDGRIDRWEYYGADQKLEKVGFSRAQDGIEDAWSFFDTAGATERIEISTRRNHKVDRIEHYEKGTLVRAEEDGDGDGRFDKWETYDGARLASVAFDTLHHGTPDRRLIYGADGGARWKSIRRAGTFVAAPGQRRHWRVTHSQDTTMKPVLYVGCPSAERAETEQLLASADLSVVWADNSERRRRTAAEERHACAAGSVARRGRSDRARPP
jgi:hypothetical protein